jgi:hypothetical protein
VDPNILQEFPNNHKTTNLKNLAKTTTSTPVILCPQQEVKECHLQLVVKEVMISNLDSMPLIK